MTSQTNLSKSDYYRASVNNVVVGVRVRPLNDLERAESGKLAVRCFNNTIIINDPSNSAAGEKTFTFDNVYSHEMTAGVYGSQEAVYSMGRNMLEHAMQGFNTCIFAYGQTGAGKTHTMMGTESDPGIIPRVCEELFQRLANRSTFKVELSYYEIYNEKVRCLLNPYKNKDLRVREHPTTGPYVEGLTRIIVNDFEDVSKWLGVGNTQRTVAATKNNMHSSRSHAVFTLTLTQTKTDEYGSPTELISKMNLVDLAGSERCGQTNQSSLSEGFREGVNINMSLSNLARVIYNLSEAPQDEAEKKKAANRNNNNWVPYRDSILTWLLKDNLGGNCKTYMLATLSPAGLNYEESLNTLRYADRVKYIRNEAVVNEDQNGKVLRELRERLQYMEAELAARPPPQESRPSFPVGDMPILINLNPNPAPHEKLAHVLMPGETYCGTDEDDGEVHRDEILMKLTDGFNLSNPHCIFDHKGTGEVECIPINGSITYVDGRLLTAIIPLHHGARIVLGSNNIFLFVDPYEARLKREQNKTKHIPRILDWEFATKEFASKMNLLANDSAMRELKEENDDARQTISELEVKTEELTEAYHYLLHLPFLVVVNPSRVAPEQLIFHLPKGKSRLGRGLEISPAGCSPIPLTIEHDGRSGHVYIVDESGLTSRIHNGYHFSSGDCTLQLCIPGEDRSVEFDKLAKMAEEGELPPGLEVRRGLIDEHLFKEDIKQCIYDMQFQVSFLFNLFYPYNENVPEDLEVSEARRDLQDDWIITSKKITGTDMLLRMTYLTTILRKVTHTAGEQVQLRDHYRYRSAAENEVRPDSQLITENIALKEEILNIRHELESSKAEKISTSPSDETTLLLQRLQETEQEVHKWQQKYSRSQQAAEEQRGDMIRKFNEVQSRIENMQRAQESQGRTVDLPKGGDTQGLRVQLEDRTRQYGELQAAHERAMSEIERIQLELEDTRTQLSRAKLDSTNGVSNDSVKAFNKMKETIKLLTRVAKTKDEKIVRLEKQLTETHRGGDEIGELRWERYKSHQVSLLLALEANENTQDTLKTSMNHTIAALKAVVVQLNKNSMPHYDKSIGTIAKIGASEAFKRSSLFIRKLVRELVGDKVSGKWGLTEEDAEKIKLHIRPHVLRALREIVVSYDMMTDQSKGVSSTDDLSANLDSLLVLSNFCIANERAKESIAVVNTSSSSTGRSSAGVGKITTLSRSPSAMGRALIDSPLAAGREINKDLPFGNVPIGTATVTTSSHANGSPVAIPQLQFATLSGDTGMGRAPAQNARLGSSSSRSSSVRSVIPVRTVSPGRHVGPPPSAPLSHSMGRIASPSPAPKGATGPIYIRRVPSPRPTNNRPSSGSPATHRTISPRPSQFR